MWFQLGVQNFIAKKTPNGDSCNIFVSDFIRIWHKSLSNNEIISISQALNPLLEASVQKIKEITLNLLEDIKVVKEVKEENNSISLKLQSSILGVKFQFQVLLNQGDGEMLYKEFTVPLLIMLMNMQSREKKLLKIIKDKDAEIKDYKQEYGPRLKYLETKTFNIKEFNSQESATNISFDPVPFLECIDAKLQSVESVPLLKQKEQKEEEDESNKTNTSHKSNANKSVFKDKSSNISSSVRPCIFLDNQTIKKRKNHNEGFKIKL